jgi:hypothetical protein
MKASGTWNDRVKKNTTRALLIRPPCSCLARRRGLHLPNHSLVPTRLPPQGERALASHLSGHRMEAVPATPRGHPGQLARAGSSRPLGGGAASTQGSLSSRTKLAIMNSIDLHCDQGTQLSHGHVGWSSSQGGSRESFTQTIALYRSLSWRPYRLPAQPAAQGGDPTPAHSSRRIPSHCHSASGRGGRGSRHPFGPRLPVSAH